MQDLIELQKKLLEDFEYKDGELYWKKKGYSRTIGKKVGSPDRNGYLHMHYRYKTVFIHRLIFLMHHGYLPKILDHIDGNPTNNRIENLREATAFQNSANSKISKSNTTGVKGVSWRKREQRYFAQCRVNGKQYEIGRFKVLEDAAKAVREFREKFHGDFARHG
jgi:hypothetical protein